MAQIAMLIVKTTQTESKKCRVVHKITSIEIATQIRMEIEVLFSRILKRSAILDKNSLGTKMGHGKSAKKL
jgi:hypothetical protein